MPGITTDQMRGFPVFLPVALGVAGGSPVTFHFQGGSRGADPLIPGCPGLQGVRGLSRGILGGGVLRPVHVPILSLRRLVAERFPVR